MRQNKLFLTIDGTFFSNFSNKKFPRFSPPKKMILKGTIYKITNRFTNFVYIGETVRDVTKRWREHQLSNNNTLFSQIMRESPPDSWEYSVIDEVTMTVEKTDDLFEKKCIFKEKLKLLEFTYILEYSDRCYNSHLHNYYICKLCGVGNGTERGLSIHMQKVHNENRWSSCDECCENTYLCSSCDEKYKSLFFPFICPFCPENKHFVTWEGFRYHKYKTHSPTISDEQKVLYKGVISELVDGYKEKRKEREKIRTIYGKCALYASSSVTPRIIDGVYYF